MLTGCSVDFDFTSSKSDQFEAVADELGTRFDASRAKFQKLEGKQKLTPQDQEQIGKEINKLKDVIADFKGEEAPFPAEKVKKLAVKELNEIEKVLVSIQEKAEKGTASKDDVKKMVNVLLDTIENQSF